MAGPEKNLTEVSFESLKGSLIERDDPDQDRVVGRLERAVKRQGQLEGMAAALEEEANRAFSQQVDATHEANVKRQTGLTPQELERLTTQLIEGEITMEEFQRLTGQTN